MAHPEGLSSHDHPNKRKRDLDDNGQPSSHDRIPQPPPPQSGMPKKPFLSRSRPSSASALDEKETSADRHVGNGAHINYLARNLVKLELIQGDADVFSDVLALVGDYEGVLSRRESLAANLGVKLTGPKIVKAMEGLFEGPISVTQRDPHNSSPVTWLDIVQFAKASPNDFNLTSTDRRRFCTFYLNGNQVEITEDDWRLIVSGTVDRFNLAPAQPLDEDENLEVATLEILEQRLQILIKKADEVARKARQLNYHLSGRKAAINSRRTSAQSPPARYAGFTPHNHQQTQLPRSKSGYDLKADLLQQFTAASSSQVRPGSARITQNSASLPSTPVIPQGPSIINSNAKHVIQPIHTNSRASPAATSEQQQAQPEDPSAAHRPLITARVEKLAKGDPINPPCDRCRRLRVQCVKHLTACQGCTRKHAKCAWKAVTDDEIAALKGDAGSGEGDGDGDDGGSRSGGGFTPDPQSASTTSIVETRTFAPTMNHNMADSGNNGSMSGGVTPSGVAAGAVEHRARERQVTDFGLREQPPRADQFRLSHMASVALNPEPRDQPPQHQQQHHSQTMLVRGSSTSGD